MKKNRLLHVASFNGNIGDNASHAGLYKTLRENLGLDFDITRWEIRQAYLNYDGADAWAFDRRFIEEVNRHDLTIVGGGNFFELWLENSPTGTTISLSPDLLAEVEKPLVFHSIGCDDERGKSAQSVARFRSFLQAVNQNPKVMIALRNDGSLQNIQRLLGEEYAKKLLVVPDSGFFVTAGSCDCLNNNRNNTLIAINFSNDKPRIKDYSQCNQHLAKVLTTVMQNVEKVELVFVPHIYKDYVPIYEILDHMPESLRRSRISIAPLLSGQGNEARIFAIYQDADLVVGSRFHTSVCAIGMGVPTIGLVTYKKLAWLYEDLGLDDRVVDLTEEKWDLQLLECITNSLLHLGDLVARYRSMKPTLEKNARRVHLTIQQLLNEKSAD